jgi:beta-galactosidase
MSKSFIDKISNQLLRKEKIIGSKFPEYTENGSWKFRDKVNWFSGFLSGELWQMYGITERNEFKDLAIAQADALLPYSKIDYTHDMGFIFLPSCVNAYRETGDKKYLKAALEAAEMLSKRFNNKGNFIRAWGALGDPDKAGWMIIDTMMNLELLFWAAEQTGNYEYYDIAYKHALTTLKEIVRSNFSSYHLVEFDPETGEILTKRTHQGFTDESTWARGQAWGIYGFANAYKFTGDERFLFASQKMADYFFEHLPDDYVPVWDLNIKDKNELRDASAGAITASGLFLLSEVSKTKEISEKYLEYAVSISSSLINNYLFINSNRENEEGILLHTIYFYKRNWGVDESYPAGDYFFMETLSKLWNHLKQKNIINDEEKRQEYLINNHWYYLEDNTKDLNEVPKSTKEWLKINLPHTWNNFDATDNVPGYRRDASWYQKNIFIPSIKNNLNFFLLFEGVNITSEVYINGKLAGGHVGGYIGFDVDITNFIKVGDTNEILVRADNSVNPDIIPSQKSDFFIYGGINRDVWLKILPSSYIINSKIYSPHVDATKASTNVDVQFYSGANKEFEIKAFVKDNSGKILTESSVKNNFNIGNNFVKIELPEFEAPLLWSPDDPNLYAILIALYSEGKLIDQTDEKFGYRWYEFKPNGAFYLNGKRLLIKGTHWHEDYAGLGNAIPDSIKEEDFKMIKNMGANFVRLAHYPQDPKVYQLCDELGLLVWDELPWCRGGIGGEMWKQNTKRMLVEMIDQNFNHPSIIIWSLGNEIYWLPDFQDGDNNDSLRSFLKELNDIAHFKDPTRLTSIRKYYEGSDIVDVFSPSIWAGWYSGVYKNYQTAIEDAQEKYPKFLHMEYGGSSHVGRHTEQPINGDGILNPNEWEESINQIKVPNIASMGDWSENYIVDLFDWHLRYTELSETFTGNAQWAFKDFGTPLRPENPIPYMNQKGLVDRAGNPKDAFYVFKSYWNKDDKFCYIESHTWTERGGPENVAREVNVFSNCNSVELFLNEQSLGIKIKDINKFPSSGLSWQVKFNDGNNKIKAVGFDKDNLITVDSLVINYTYEKARTPENINLSAERMPNSNYLITAIVIDKDGLRCLDYNKRIYFSVSGSGYLFENFGTPTRSSIIEAANGKAQIEFKPFGFEEVIIEVRNQDFKGHYLNIN